MPHSFQNLDTEVAELVVIFPSNVWESDVLDVFPFSTPEAKEMAQKAREKGRDARVSDAACLCALVERVRWNAMAIVAIFRDLAGRRWRAPA